MLVYCKLSHCVYNLFIRAGNRGRWPASVKLVTLPCLTFIYRNMDGNGNKQNRMKNVHILTTNTNKCAARNANKQIMYLISFLTGYHILFQCYNLYYVPQVSMTDFVYRSNSMHGLITRSWANRFLFSAFVFRPSLLFWLGLSVIYGYVMYRYNVLYRCVYLASQSFRAVAMPS